MKFDASDSDNDNISNYSNGSNKSLMSASSRSMSTSAHIDYTQSMRLAEYKPIKKDLRGITDQKKLRSYVIENQELLHDIPTALLNTWVNIPGYKLYRSRGVLGVSKVSDTRYTSMVSVNERIDKLQDVLTKMIVLLELDPKVLGLNITSN
jgi:hypothetical protein